jgi:hypothetical protein
MISIATKTDTLTTCPVCGPTDVRVKPNGKLHNHGVGRGAPVTAIIPGCAFADFKLCAGSGQVVDRQPREVATDARL